MASRVGSVARFGAVVLVAASAVAFGLANRGDVRDAVQAIRTASLAYVIVGLLLAGCSLLNLAGFHAAAQRAAGLDVHTRELVCPVAAAGFLNVVVKSGAMAGLAPMLRHARRRGRSPGATLAGYVLVNLLGHFAFACLLVGSVVVLVVEGRFGRVDAVAVVTFFVLSSGQLALVYAATKSRAAVRRLHALPRRMLRRLRGADPTTAGQENTESADELFEAVALLRANLRSAGPAFGHALVVEVIGIAQLYCVLRAIGEHPALSVPVLAYAISVLFTIVGILPGGLGAVEAGLGALLVSRGIPGSHAVAAVVLFRLLELWFPLLVGLAASRLVLRKEDS